MVEVRIELGLVLATGQVLAPQIETLGIPLLRILALGAALRHPALCRIVGDLLDVRHQVFAIEDLVALLIDNLTLLVHGVLCITRHHV